MSATQDISVELVAIAAVRAALSAREKELKAAYLDEQGGRGRTAPKVGDEEVGLVYSTAGSTTAKVTDPQALLRYALAHYPTEVEQVVRPAFAKVLCDRAKTGGDVDEYSGEVRPIPGVTVDTGDPTVTVKPNAVAARMVADQVRGRMLHLGRAAEPKPSWEEL